MPKINLDALLPREDFEAVGNKSQAAQINSFSITDLNSQFIYQVLRKPDFQRWSATVLYCHSASI